MRKSHKLYKLIGALTMSEKRYFSLYASRHTIGKKNLSIRLFEIIERNAINNDKELRQQLKVKGMELKNISSDKNYLFNSILRSLNEFHYAKTSNLKIKTLLHQAEVLHTKKLYEIALELIEKAKVDAWNHQQYSMFIEASKMEINCRTISGDTESLNDIMKDMKKAMSMLDSLHTSMQLYAQVFTLYHVACEQGSVTVKDQLKTIMSHTFLHDESHTSSLYAKMYIIHTYRLNYMILRDKQLLLELNQKMWQMFLTLEDEVLNAPEKYIQLLKELSEFFVKEYNDSVNSVLEDFRRLYHKWKYTPGVFDIYAEFWKEFYSTLLAFYHMSYDQVVVHMKTLERFTHEHVKQLEPAIIGTMCYLKILFHIQNQQFNKSLQVAHEFFQSHYTDDQDTIKIYLSILILKILIYINLNDLVGIKLIIRETHIQLKKSKYKRPVISAVLSFLNQQAIEKGDNYIPSQARIIEITNEQQSLVPFFQGEMPYLDLLQAKG